MALATLMGWIAIHSMMLALTPVGEPKPSSVLEVEERGKSCGCPGLEQGLPLLLIVLGALGLSLLVFGSRASLTSERRRQGSFADRALISSGVAQRLLAV